MQIEISNKWTVGSLIDHERERFLRVNHEYQRGLRWSDMQKRMFIDSIFRGYSIPAFYFHKNQVSAGANTNTYFDIVDGQQRIDAIYRYSEGAFSLLDPSDDKGFRFPNFVKDVPCPWGGKRFSDLSENLKKKLKDHKVIVYEIVTDNENSIRDLFIRLQGGTPLTPQDKRDSWPGNFTEFVLSIGGKSDVPKWPGIPLFKEIYKVKKESSRRQLVAQVFMLFWMIRKEMKFCDIKSANIDEFYHSQVGFDSESKEAKDFEKICKKLYEAFRNKGRIYGHYIIHLVLLADSLLKEYAPGWENHIAEKLHEFEKCRSEAADAEKKRLDTEYQEHYSEYGRWAQTQSDVANTIRRRHAFFSKEMLKLLSLKKLDGRRGFSELERKTVFFRDGELCQWCRMKGDNHKVFWSECQIHHVTPHAHGGPTDLENAALVHHDCHPRSAADVQKFRDWWYKPGTAMPEPARVRQYKSRRLPPDGTEVWFAYNGLHYGEIRNGKLVLSGDHEGTACQSFTEASRVITQKERNGWKDWWLRLPNEEVILADEWRKRE